MIDVPFSPRKMSHCDGSLSKKLSINKDIDKMCRVCLTADTNNMVHLFTPQGECDGSNMIYDKIMLCARVHIDPKDCFPRYICSGCMSDLETAVNFKIRCEKSECLLKQIKLNVTENVGEDSFRVMNVKPELDINCDDTIAADSFQVSNIKEEIIFVADESTSEHNTAIRKKLKRKQFCCKICMKVYKHRQTYISHKRTAHIKENPICKIYNISGVGRNRIFHCIKCEYSSTKNKRVEVHFRTHTGEKPYSCNLCASSYSQLSTLLRHKKTAHSTDTPFSCELCGRQFKLCSSLKRHQVTHRADFPYKCDVCDKCFKWKHVLDDHHKRHGTIRSMGCEVCGRLFVSKVDLLNHLLIHKKHTLYSCELCTFKTHVKSYLKRHVWTHTGEARCACEICGKIFSKRGNLLAHKQVHSSERLFECELCDKKYKQKCVLKKHVQNSHNEKNTGCKNIN